MPLDRFHTPLTIDVEKQENSAIVHCHGRLVAGVGDWFYPEVRKLIPECKRITLDLNDLLYLDSMGIGTLVRLYVSGLSNGCRVWLINLGPHVREVLGITHLLSILTETNESEVSLRS
jgi:anti-sigma B factor antagonist